MTVIFPAALLVASTFTILFFAHLADRRTDRRTLKFDAAVAAATMKGLQHAR